MISKIFLFFMVKSQNMYMFNVTVPYTQMFEAALNNSIDLKKAIPRNGYDFFFHPSDDLTAENSQNHEQNQLMINIRHSSIMQAC